MIGKLLGHTQVATTARYTHLAADPVKAAAEQVSSEIGRRCSARDMRKLLSTSDARSFDQRQEHASGQVFQILCRRVDARGGGILLNMRDRAHMGIGVAHQFEIEGGSV